jgi:RIO kinase 1
MTFVSAPLPARDSTREDSDMAEGAEADTDRADDAEGAAAVDAAGNNHAFKMLERDVGNMSAYFGQFAPELKFTKYAKEMWALYEAGELTPDSPLTGEFDDPEEEADIDAVMREIKAALADEARRQALLNAEDEPKGEEPPPPWAQ